MEPHRIVSRDEWLVARKAHLADEKALTKARDEVARKRRELPWVKVDKTYRFEGPKGPETLTDLFDGRSQLIVQHFMLAPDWEEGCTGCSFLADHVDGARRHFENRDVGFVAVSRAPLAEIERFKRRMGWGFKWVSSHGSDFNYDYHVSFTPEEVASGGVYYNYTKLDFAMDELHGTSVFCKNAAGEVFHTYSTYARGPEMTLGTFMFLDMTPKGRNEASTMDWVRLHDRYDDSIAGQSNGRAGEDSASCCASGAAHP